MASLAGKICLITGGAGRERPDRTCCKLTSGIGRACVDRFVSAGATVISADVVQPDSEGVDNIVCDQGDPKSVIDLERHVRERYLYC